MGDEVTLEIYVDEAPWGSEVSLSPTDETETDMTSATKALTDIESLGMDIDAVFERIQNRVDQRRSGYVGTVTISEDGGFDYELDNYY